MAIPKYQDLMLPLLRSVADGKEHALRELRTPLADEFGLTLEERTRKLPNGNATVFANRLAWAKVYLEKAKLLEKTRRSFFRIADPAAGYTPQVCWCAAPRRPPLSSRRPAPIRPLFLRATHEHIPKLPRPSAHRRVTLRSDTRFPPCPALPAHPAPPPGGTARSSTPERYQVRRCSPHRTVVCFFRRRMAARCPIAVSAICTRFRRSPAL
ncbi:MAG: hypothetical protein D6725_07435 [Planctomycetota bacterium]|nr:MAG: hypothetical protein D6725_07435 [Planctomycetota bacterium]